MAGAQARGSGTAPRPDIGRVVMVPAASAMILLDVRALLGARSPLGAQGGAAGATAVLGVAGAVLAGAFYAQVAWCYLRRGPATASSSSPAARIIAVAATVAPFAFPLLAGRPPSAARQFAADALLVAGTAWAAWSLHCLGRNLSVVAQARAIADRGPYQWVRHPLYTGELACSLGLALAAGTAPAWALWLALAAMQAARAREEERVLLAALPGYRGYRARTAAFLPGLL